jgi:hypothetical protein
MACVSSGRVSRMAANQGSWPPRVSRCLGVSIRSTSWSGRTGADAIAVLACPEMDGPALRHLSWNLARSGIDLFVAPALMDVTGPRIAIRPVCGLPLLHVDEPVVSGGRRNAKACLDRVVSAAALVILLPLLVGIGGAVRISSPGPALFRRGGSVSTAASSPYSNSEP